MLAFTLSSQVVNLWLTDDGDHKERRVELGGRVLEA